ncbi:DNA-binding response regulator [Bacteroidia bacterium]|nr:DNA-binding response regulator [Bacteroidia bacterium]
MAKILLVEDEVNIASFIERGLREFDHEVRTAYNGADGWELIQKERFQLLILDVIMPKMNGLELCAKYRAAYGFDSPVIMLTALGTTEDIVKGLEAGADDYLVKPFRFQELEARIQALLRRTKNKSADDTSILVCGDLVLETENHRATRGGSVIDLTVREYRLLEYLMTNKGTALSRQSIIKHVWDKEADRNMNVVDVYVNYLRMKIDKGFETKLIHTVSGIGYRMEA